MEILAVLIVILLLILVMRSGRKHKGIIHETLPALSQHHPRPGEGLRVLQGRCFERNVMTHDTARADVRDVLENEAATITGRAQ